MIRETSRNGNEAGFAMPRGSGVQASVNSVGTEHPNSFKVANVICRFNSGSGGPPRTVSSIAVAGRGIWEAELFTTDYVAPEADSLLIENFRGHVSLFHRNAQTLLGGLLMATGLWPTLRTQLIRSIHPHV